MFNTKINETTFVVFDLETTGFNPVTEQMIEIGAVKVDSSGNVLETFSEFIKLYKVAKLSPKIKELTNITDNMLEIQGKDIHDVMELFVNFIGDSVLVAQNSRFDMSFMAAYFLQNHKLTYSRLCFDTIKFGKALKPGMDSYRLQLLAPMFNVMYDANAHHRADYDAEITSQIFINQIKMMNLPVDATINNLISIEGGEEITSKQESFLNSLITKHGISTNQLELFNKQTASSHIDIILNLDKHV